MSEEWEAYALRYAERAGRTRADSFILDDDHASPHDIDYYVWLLRSGDRTIVRGHGLRRRRGGAPRPPDPARPGRGAAALRRAPRGRGHGDRHAPALRPRRRPGALPAGDPTPPGGRDGLRHGAVHVPRGAADALHGRARVRDGAPPLRGPGGVPRGRRGGGAGRHGAPGRRPLPRAPGGAGAHAGGLAGARLGCGALLRELGPGEALPHRRGRGGHAPRLPAHPLARLLARARGAGPRPAGAAALPGGRGRARRLAAPTRGRWRGSTPQAGSPEARSSRIHPSPSSIAPAGRYSQPNAPR